MMPIKSYIRCVICGKEILVDEPPSRRIKCECGEEYSPSGRRTFSLLRDIPVLTKEYKIGVSDE